jgi:hypothetical protein
MDLENERKVKYEEGMNFAIENGIEFIEVSANENINIDNIFLILTKKYFDSKQN